jgi:hypothetical protein
MDIGISAFMCWLLKRLLALAHPSMKWLMLTATR